MVDDWVVIAAMMTVLVAVVAVVDGDMDGGIGVGNDENSHHTLSTLSFAWLPSAVLMVVEVVVNQIKLMLLPNPYSIHPLNHQDCGNQYWPVYYW